MRYALTACLVAMMVAIAACDSAITPDTQDALSTEAPQKSEKAQVGVNIVLNTPVTDAILADLKRQYGPVLNVFEKINAVRIRASEQDVPAIQALPYVEAASPDAERDAPPFDAVAAEDFADGLSTWNLDAINVTDFGFDNRVVPYDGTGVFIGVLDSGLLYSWRQYFPEERIAEEYAIAFGGGGGERGHVSQQPNKWEHDTSSHGTHVTSTILGYNFGGTPINGVAPGATVIPVKVLNQPGFGWSSVVAMGIMYIAELKEGPLANSPVVINMSLSGPVLDPIEQAAIDYALSVGVIICASAGNRGEAGMGYPGAYAPVISAAASGWVGEWTDPSWWWALDVPDPTDAEDFYITDFSGRELADQDLDVAAPGSWIVGPYQLQQGQTSYFYVGGTSQASPHVAGTVALMLQQNPGLTAAAAESILESTALPLAPGCRNVTQISGAVEEICWGADATGEGLLLTDAALAAGMP